jgi:hypothetical protein
MVSLLARYVGDTFVDFGCQDIRSFVESVKFTRRIAQQEPFKRILKGISWANPAMPIHIDPLLFLFSFVEELLPGPSVQTDEEIISALSGTHTHSSCALLTLFRFCKGTFQYNIS